MPASQRSRAVWIVPILAAAGFGLAVALVPPTLAFVVPAAAALSSLFLVPLTRRRATYYAVQIFGLLCYLVTVPSTLSSTGAQIVLHTVFLMDLILTEPFPLNLIGSLTLAAVSSLVRTLGAGLAQPTLLSVAQHASPFVVPAVVVAIVGSLMTKHREQVVDLIAGRAKLRLAVVDLAKANTVYQDYAVGARERAAESERQRITRDIHDIVGYTLTNNMMLMEAALDLMKENALALPAIIETARLNAQEGLEQVRSALYRLREQDGAYAVGLIAIARLVRIFEQATAIRIRCDFSNMPAVLAGPIDSAIYHLVQEALVNSFRHGRATEIHVQFWYDPSMVQVWVRDNGAGGAPAEEGIGLKGMRERIESLGGQVRAGPVPDGFLVAATIPLETITHDETASNPHR